MDRKPNLHNNPEAYGLERVGAADQGYGYEWDTFEVYRDTTGTGYLYYVSGSGCSCSDMSLYAETPDDLTRATAYEIHDAIDAWVKPDSLPEAVDLHARVADLR